MAKQEGQDYVVLIWRASDASNQITITKTQQMKRVMRELCISEDTVLQRFDLKHDWHPGSNPVFLIEALAAMDDAAGTVTLWTALERIILRTWEEARSRD